jgi:hypothetical protein
MRSEAANPNHKKRPTEALISKLKSSARTLDIGGLSLFDAWGFGVWRFRRWAVVLGALLAIAAIASQ